MSATAALFGYALQTYSIPIVLALTWTSKAPHMLLIALFAATLAIAAQVIPAVFYILANVGMSDDDLRHRGSELQGLLNGLYLLISLCSQEIFRILLCFALVHAELQFRQRKQSLSGSKFGTIFTGLAAGTGFATMQSIFSAGAAINLATSTSYNTAIGYDYLNCPLMPILEATVLSNGLLIVANISWTIIVLQCVAAIVVLGKVRQQEAEGIVFPNDDDVRAVVVEEGTENIATADNNTYEGELNNGIQRASPTVASRGRSSLLPGGKGRRQAMNREEEEDGVDDDEVEGHNNNGREGVAATELSPASPSPPTTAGGVVEGAVDIDERAGLLENLHDNNTDKNAKEKKKSAAAAASKKGKRASKTDPSSTPAPPINYKSLNPSELSRSQARMFCVCIFVLHGVFRAVTLIYSSSTVNRNLEANNAYTSDDSSLNFYDYISFSTSVPFSGNKAVGFTPPSFPGSTADVNITGACGVVLPIQTFTALFSVLLAAIVAWTDRR